MGERNLDAIRFVCYSAEELINSSFGEKIANLRREGYSYSDIADHLQLVEKLSLSCDENSEIPRSIVAFVIKGNDRDSFGNIYSGLLSDDENRKITNNTRRDMSYRQRRFGGDTKAFRKSLVDNAKKASCAAGCQLWDDGESLLAYILSNSRDYQIQRNGLYHANSLRISQTINKLWHDDKEVRTPVSVKQHLFKIRRGDKELPLEYRALKG